MVIIVTVACRLTGCRPSGNPTCRRFVHNLYVDRNSCANDRKAQPGDQQNARLLCWFLDFSPIRNLLGRIVYERMSEWKDSPYEQFDVSPETIEKELPPVDCEHRQTDRFKENYLSRYLFLKVSKILT